MRSTEAGAREVVLAVEAPGSAPVTNALAELEKALHGKGCHVVRGPWPGHLKTPSLVAAQAGASARVDELLAAERLTVPRAPESLCVKNALDSSPPRIFLAGRDGRGLTYALLDAARSIELAKPGSGPLGAIEEAAESPFLPERGISVHLFNADLERDWYYDEAFWRDYFSMLARNRYNSFALTFADHTSYLCPPYPFLVHVPECPAVKAKALAEEQRRRNLETLRFISQLARDWGIDFTLSAWMQRPFPPQRGPSMVEGLPEYPRDYCAKGLERVLLECPAIGRVQFRMNQESGISEDMQTDFFRAQFQAIRNCSRPVAVDLRFKGLREATIAAAVEAGLEVTVSTKYWCEHMGLPYHPTVVDRHYRDGRYGYADMLRRPRPYGVLYRLWTVGSQRVLLWGDPAYGARFARSCPQPLLIFSAYCRS